MPAGKPSIPVTIGARFGRLRILSELESIRDSSGHRIRIVLCECDCGAHKALRYGHLRSGLTASCGCFRKEATSKRKTTHGHRVGALKTKPTKAYTTWAAMLRRCNNPNAKGYEDYGGRGIKVCEHWHKFENFLADMGEPEEDMTIEREKNEIGYGPGNCSWKPRAIQNLNKRNVAKLTLNGRTMTAPEWAEVTGIPKKTITARIRLGWSVEKALTTQVYASPVADGDRFGRWTVICEAAPRPPSRRYFRCRCECGAERDVYSRSLLSGMSTSCGCGRLTNSA